jgi:hypothetical protein
MTELINLTPHAIRVYSSDTPDQVEDVGQGLIATIEASGKVARVAENDLGTEERIAFGTHTHGAVHIPIELIEYSSVHGIPSQREGVYLIVPLVTALSVLASAHSNRQGRNDLLVPYAQVRNTEGTVVGCRLLARPC